jgi:hypothetical protein
MRNCSKYTELPTAPPLTALLFARPFVSGVARQKAAMAPFLFAQNREKI